MNVCILDNNSLRRDSIWNALRTVGGAPSIALTSPEAATANTTYLVHINNFLPSPALIPAFFSAIDREPSSCAVIYSGGYLQTKNPSARSIVQVISTDETTGCWLFDVRHPERFCILPEPVSTDGGGRFAKAFVASHQLTDFTAFSQSLLARREKTKLTVLLFIARNHMGNAESWAPTHSIEPDDIEREWEAGGGGNLADVLALLSESRHGTPREETLAKAVASLEKQLDCRGHEPSNAHI